MCLDGFKPPEDPQSIYGNQLELRPRMKQGGSLNRTAVPNTTFQYTTSKQRREWVRHTYPLGDYLIFSVIEQIPWHTYTWSGETTLAVPVSESDTDFTDMSVLARASTAAERPYTYFGGSVFEILHHLFPTIPLRDLVDPTGDIDILLHIPYPRLELPKEAEAAVEASALLSDVTAQGTLTPLAADFTKWVFNQFCLQLRRIPDKIWEDMFGDCESFDPFTVDPEGEITEIFKRGNVCVQRIPIVSDTMSKIQLVAQFPGLEPDHLVEFVVPLRKTDIDSATMFETSDTPTPIQRLNWRFPIVSFSSTIRSNAQAMRERSEINESAKHKFWNHVGRQQYLNRLIPHISKDDFEYEKTKLAHSIFFMCIQLFLLKKSGFLTQSLIDSMISNMLPLAFEDSYDRLGRRISVGISGTHIRVYELKGTPFEGQTYADILREIAPRFHIAAAVKKGGRRRTRRLKSQRRRL